MDVGFVKAIQNVFQANYYQKDRQLGISCRSYSEPYKRRSPPMFLKIAFGVSTSQLSYMSECQNSFVKCRHFYCNASSTSAVSPLERIEFLKLQNGSDIRGVAVSGVEGEPITLTCQATEAIGAAFALWLLDKKRYDMPRSFKISVGHDSRISARNLQDSVSRGIARAGIDVVQYGLASTPAMFNSTICYNEQYLCPVDGSVMITASHLPYNRNGLKFFTNAGGLGKNDIKDILERASDLYSNFTAKVWEGNASAHVNRVDYMSVYAANLVEAVCVATGNKEKPLEGFRIVVDAGNGSGGFFVEKVLEPLGAITTGSKFLEPNGLFPNHIPNPEDKVAMQSIIQAVLDNMADLGIIFDTDVDRSAAVDSTGREFNRNRLIALMSAIILEQHPGTTIVTDSVTSDGLTTFIEKKLGGRHLRFKRGYKNVIDEAIRLNSIGQECHLAIETSGHGALKENHWLDDGAYLMVKLLIKLASARASGRERGTKVLNDLIEGLEEATFSIELRLKIDHKHSDLKGRSFQEYGEAVLKHLENSVGSNPGFHKPHVNYEGVRVSGFGGWFLLRLSLHDPVLPLNIEASSRDDAVKLGLAVLAVVSEFPALDTSSLDKFVRSN